MAGEERHQNFCQDQSVDTNKNEKIFTSTFQFQNDPSEYNTSTTTTTTSLSREEPITNSQNNSQTNPQSEPTNEKDSQGHLNRPDNPPNSPTSSTVKVGENGEVLLPEDKIDRLRFKTVMELIDSERDYVRDIDIIIKYIYNPIHDNNIISKDDVKNMFSNISQLHMINKQLLGNLETALKEANNDYNAIPVGAIVLEMAEYLKGYMSYVSNQDLCMSIIERNKKKNPKFEKFLKELTEKNELRGLDIISFLIKPMQRICKYPLFLRELLKHTREDNEDRPKLETAQTRLDRVAALVNESKLKNENQAKIREIAQSLTGISPDKIIQPSRLFVEEATFVKLSKGHEQERHFFLFNDTLIWAKIIEKNHKYAYRGEISMELTLCNEVTRPELIQGRHGFELCRLDKKKKKYVIYTNTQAEKEHWMSLLWNCHTQASARTIKSRPSNHSSSSGALSKFSLLGKKKKELSNSTPLMSSVSTSSLPTMARTDQSPASPLSFRKNALKNSTRGSMISFESTPKRPNDLASNTK